MLLYCAFWLLHFKAVCKLMMLYRALKMISYGKK